jgi:transcriptional regulator with XRE-family HTH domain
MKKKINIELYPGLEKMGARIVKLREATGFNQCATAKQLGLSRSNLKKIEEGAGLPSILTVYTICRHFHVSADSIIFGEERYSSHIREENGDYTYENKLMVEVPHEKMVESLNMLRKAWEQGDDNQKGWIVVELEKLARQAAQNL